MPFLLIAAAAGLVCATPVHRDGASLRCDGSPAVLTLDGIKVLPPGGPCFRPEDCPTDIGRMAQDQLAELTRGQKVMCRPARRGTVRCTAGGRDLSCAMLASGLAKGDGAALGCPVTAKPPPRPVPVSPFAPLVTYRNWILAGLVLINLLTFAAFLEDRRRLRKGLNRVADIHLLALAMFGGSLGGFIAQQSTGHLRDDEPFASQFTVLMGLQIGAAIGLLAIPIA